MKKSFLILLLTLSISLIGCGNNTNNLKTTSTDIEKISKSIYPKDIYGDQVVSLQYVDDSIISYKWWDQDGNLLGQSSSIEWIAPKEPGKYTITVETINNQKENEIAQIVIKVVSGKPDKKPTISLNDNDTIEFQIGEKYNELGAEAFDEEDGNITDKIKISNNIDSSKVGIYKVQYSVKDSAGNISRVFRTVKVKDYKTDYFIPAHSFKDIKALLKDAKNGNIQNATYICLGDSTRANSVLNSQIYFYAIAKKLNSYNVSSILLARRNHKLKQFLDESMYPTLSNVLNTIPSDGSTTLLEISLGVNDLFEQNELHKDNPFYFTNHKKEYKKIIKSRLIKAIEEIKKAKAKTSIFLVTPNAIRDWKGGTTFMVNIYEEVAEEKNLPLANFTHDRMKDGKTTEKGEFNNWYRDKIHFSDKGLNELSSYILSKILPN